MILEICLAAALAGYPLGFFLHTRRLRAVFMRGTQVLASDHGSLQVRHEELREQLERAREVATEERERADRYFLKIEAVVRERDDWHDKHVHESIGHGNAQNLMMQTIEQMAQVLTAHKIKFRIPRVLQEVRADFQGQFEMPARAEVSETKGKTQAPSPPDTPPSAA